MISSCGKYLSQPSLRTKIYIYIYIIFKIYVYIYTYRIQKFWGHMLQRHSNPTKNKVWWPRQTKLLVGFGLRFLRVFMGLDEFLQVCDVFFRGLWRSCFIKNLVLLTKTCFFSQKTTQNKVLIARPVFCQGFGWCRLYDMMMISSCGKYLSQPSLRTKIYIYIYILYLKSMYIYIYRIQKFWGHMLQRHSNPTKNKVWWPRQTKLPINTALVEENRGLSSVYRFCSLTYWLLYGGSPLLIINQAAGKRTYCTWFQS